VKILRLTVVPFVAVAVAASVSCAGDSKSKSTSTTAATEGFQEKDLGSWANSLGGSGYTQNDKGQWVPKDHGKRSSFETNRESPYFKGKYVGKEYKTGDYEKKAWLGGKSYERKAYEGKTDGSRFVKNSRFDGQNAREASQSAREATQSANESQQTYATSQAREATQNTMPQPTDAGLMDKRYEQPDVIDWRQQRALSVDQTKSMLGR
jgi:hypothetical protein